MATVLSLKKRPRLQFQVARTMTKFGMIRPEEHVLVAVSGGADSTALLLCLHELAPVLGIRLSAAHLNHCLRGEESEADALFVRNLCTELGLALICEAIPVSRNAAAARGNLEETAREVRYDFLTRAARQAGAQKIALGHTQNDQAETVLMRLFRGSGSRGLTGIQPVLAGLFIRPLLECQRPEITSFLGARGAEYREDSTNRDLHYRRNRVRLEVLPYVEKHLNPNAVRTLARHAAVAREVSDYLEKQAVDALEAVREPAREGISLSVKKLLELHPLMQKMSLRLALREIRGSLRGINQRHVEAMVSLYRPGQSGRTIELPGGYLAARQFHSLVLCPNGDAPVSFSYELTLPGRRRVHEAGMDICADFKDRDQLPAKLESTAHRAYLDADRLPQSLTVRSRLPGDRYGGPGRKKVKRMLIDARIPLRARSSLPMVAAPGGVIWIPGFQPAKSVAVNLQTARCLVLEAEKTP